MFLNLFSLFVKYKKIYVVHYMQLNWSTSSENPVYFVCNGLIACASLVFVH